MVNWFDYNGVNSYSNLAALVKDKNIFASAAPDITALQIPGRSGDLFIDNNRYNNIDVSYTCAIIAAEDFARAAQKIRAALLANAAEYKRLADSYDADYFRLAVIKKAIDITQKGPHDGEIKVIFNCKPFRYSFAGQKVITLTTPKVITNFERCTALPYIKITGSGAVTLTINGAPFNVTRLNGYIEIDSERLTAYKGSENAAALTNCQAFPVLQPGANNITWQGNITAVEIIPRWRAL